MPSLKQTLFVAAVALAAEALQTAQAMQPVPTTMQVVQVPANLVGLEARHDICNSGDCPSKDIRNGLAGPASFDFVRDGDDWHLRVDDCGQCIKPVRIGAQEGTADFTSCERQQKMYYNVADKNWRADRTWKDTNVKKCYTLGGGGTSCQIYYLAGEKSC